MKHLFRVHSNLTFAMAMHVVRSQQLPEQEVVFIVNRAYQTPPECTIKTLRSPYEPLTALVAKIAFWKSWAAVKTFDQWLQQAADGQPFYWYAEHSYSNVFHLTITHPLCRGYYYFEEGSIVYCPPDSWAIKKPFNPFRALIYWLNFGKRNPTNRHYFTTQYGNYLGCYGITEDSFGNLPKKKIIGFPFSPKQFSEQYQCIIVHDNLYDLFPPSKFLPWVEAMVADAVKRGCTRIHHKFHPAQTPATIEAITSFIQKQFEGKVELVLMGGGVLIEEIIVSQKPIVYVCVSSVGIYAHLAGAQVISIFKRCYQDAPELFETYKSLLPSFLTK